MPSYAACKLEFSPDPLSDTTPSWIDVTRYCQSAEWSSGKARDLDDSQAGSATFVLRNDQRRFEPEYTAGAYYPNIVPMRRFRLSIVTAAGTVQQGIYYATSWNVTYPAGTDYSVVEVPCTDGFAILSLAKLPTLDPPQAQSLPDVYAADSPYAHYRLGEQFGTKMTAEIGTDGTYTGFPINGGIQNAVYIPMVPGDPSTGLAFPFTGAGNAPTGRAKLDQANNFGDTNAFTVEAVFRAGGSGVQQIIAAGPIGSGGLGRHIFTLLYDNANTRIQLSIAYAPLLDVDVTSLVGTITAGVTYHIAGTWDGHTGYVWINGLAAAGANQGGAVMVTGAANDYLYIGDTTNDGTFFIQDVAFYEQALSADRIKAHADAALNRGYPRQSVGDRINAVATNPLWSVAGIGSSQLTAAPVMQTGQALLDEITRMAAAEKPFGIFYFNDVGNPAYYDWDDTRVVTPAATFGDGPGEVPYTAIAPVYDDEIYNEVTASREAGDAALVYDDATSQGQYYVRGFDASSLPLNTDTDAGRVGQTILDQFSTPMFRIESISLNGASRGALTHILNREIGDTIRVRRLSSSGVPIDVITTILGKAKSIDPNGNLTCTWNLGRGFSAANQTWRLGVNGYDELGQTAVLA